MNNKGFIQAYILFLFLVILMIVQLLYARYTTVLQYRTSSKNAYYCEMYLFHNITKKIKSSEETQPSKQLAQDDQNDEVDDTIETTNTLQYKQCQINLEQQKNIIYAQYQSEDIQHGLIITMDQESKEIVDVVYEY